MSKQMIGATDSLSTDRDAGYSWRLFSSVDEIPTDAWEEVCRHGRNPFMDPRFLTAVERSMAEHTTVLPVIFYDSREKPRASAVLSIFRCDGALFAGRAVRKLTAAVRRLWPGFLYYRILLCGLPVSGGQSHLQLTPGAILEEVLLALDRALNHVAEERKLKTLVLKEFGAADSTRMDATMQSLDYLRAHSVPMNHFEPRFSDMDAFCSALRSHYRYKIRRSKRKFEQSGLHVVHLKGREGMESLYTDEVHKLYEAVLDQAAVKFERLPGAFFRELCRQFPDETHFTLVYQGDRIVAFACGLLTDAVYRSLFIGVDYEVNEESDLYFNLMYQQLDHALRQRPRDIHVGQTADTFKSRLGCYQQPLYFYVKGKSLFTRITLRPFARVAFPPPERPESRDLFPSPPHVAPHVQADRNVPSGTKKPKKRRSAKQPAAGRSAGARR